MERVDLSRIRLRRKRKSQSPTKRALPNSPRRQFRFRNVVDSSLLDNPLRPPLLASRKRPLHLSRAPPAPARVRTRLLSPSPSPSLLLLLLDRTPSLQPSSLPPSLLVSHPYLAPPLLVSFRSPPFPLLVSFHPPQFPLLVSSHSPPFPLLVSSRNQPLPRPLVSRHSPHSLPPPLLLPRSAHR
jgi:hypothetical protein